MYGQSRAWFFGVSTAFAVTAIGFLAYRVVDHNPRLFARAATPAAQAPVPAASPQSPEQSAIKSAIASQSGALLVFDIVRVEPTGEAVVAGRATPGATVTLLNKGVAIAQGKANQSGEFAIVPPALGAGEHLLTLEIAGEAATGKAQTVTVAIPADRRGEVVVALAEPGAATRILSDAAPVQRTPSPQLAIRSVEVDEAGGFYATGSGAPGATIRLSLNGTAVATVEAGRDGRWSLKVERGMSAGGYAVRADQVDPAGKILAQAEVPFDYPERSSAVATAAASQGGRAADAAHAVVPEVQSVTVQRGDSLWRISQRLLGSGHRYTQIYAANNSQIRNPSLIFPNQVLVVPGGSAPGN